MGGDPFGTAGTRCRLSTSFTSNRLFPFPPVVGAAFVGGMDALDGADTPLVVPELLDDGGTSFTSNRLLRFEIVPVPVPTVVLGCEPLDGFAPLAGNVELLIPVPDDCAPIALLGTFVELLAVLFVVALAGATVPAT